MAQTSEVLRVSTLDYHTAGEPLRIVTAGLPEIPGDTMLEKRRYMAAELDHIRKLLMLEPRGHADMYGAMVTEPVTGDGDVGVLFMHNAGYSTMCGHGIIALVTAGLEHQLFPVVDPGRVRIDTPAGRIVARAQSSDSGKVTSVSFKNVPSFVLDPNFVLEFNGEPLSMAIAFGGAFYAYVDAGHFALELTPAEAPRLIELGRAITRAVMATRAITHPGGEEDLGFLYGTIFVRMGPRQGCARNVCIFADGELDRSPTGTGVSGLAAIEYQKHGIGLNDAMEIESILGTKFTVRCVEETSAGGLPAVVPEVTGSAHISGEHTFILDRNDPLRDGFLIR
jgi:trans-L-3-hydroxyproline dehydratase